MHAAVNPSHAPAAGPLIRLQRIAKSFVEGEMIHAVLDEVDLEVAAGEFIAVLGRSGTGKSTLLNLISGIDLPDAGDITVRDQVINRLNEQQRTLFRRRHVGFVFQFFNLLSTLTVEENVLLPLQLNGVERAIDRVHDLLERVDLADRGTSFPDRLSGGEQQRVAIARALAHDPEILLADEPTGNLDVDTGRDVMRLLDELAHDQNKILIVATHSHEVAGCADRAVRIVDHGLQPIAKGEL